MNKVFEPTQTLAGRHRHRSKPTSVIKLQRTQTGRHAPPGGCYPLGSGWINKRWQARPACAALPGLPGFMTLSQGDPASSSADQRFDQGDCDAFA